MNIRSVTLGLAGLLVAAMTLPAHAGSTSVGSDALSCTDSGGVYTLVLNGSGKDVSTCVTTSATYQSAAYNLSAPFNVTAGRNTFCEVTGSVDTLQDVSTSVWNGSGKHPGWGAPTTVTNLISTATGVVVSKTKGACPTV